MSLFCVIIRIMFYFVLILLYSHCFSLTSFSPQGVVIHFLNMVNKTYVFTIDINVVMFQAIGTTSFLNQISAFTLCILSLMSKYSYVSFACSASSN